MNHHYINYEKLYDCSKVPSFERIYKDLRYRYKIRNLDFQDDEAVYFLVETLREDIEEKRINYMAFIEEHMDIRLLFELRRNALIRLEEPQMKVYCAKHKKFSTVKQVADYRKEVVSKFIPDYIDLDWQYAMLIRDLWGISPLDFYFDFDCCFKDGNPELARTPEDYKREFVDLYTDLYRKLIKKNYGIDLGKYY